MKDYIRLKIGEEFVSRHFDKGSFKPSFCNYYTVLRFIEHKHTDNGHSTVMALVRSESNPKGITFMFPAVYAYFNDETGVISSVEIQKKRVSPLDGSRRIFKKLLSG